ncbi:Y-family DNA polymerase [Shewanella waksmanii]|uniref:Y-family DNA polymerase n=1 Tax=Shewanella waksmanii TaxID=213783 RepID=UPI00048A7B80|nr:DNA polymerase Y family protein [Shewanella waksmanii]
MIWLAIYFPSGVLQYQRLCHDISAARPVAFYDPQQLTILAVEGADKAVTVGLSVATAQALCAELVLIEYQSNLTEQYTDWLAKWSYSYSARVVIPSCAIQSQCRGDSTQVMDVLLLEVGSMQQVFSGLDNLLHQYATQASGYGFRWQMVLAEHPLMAQLLAVHRPQLTSESELISAQGSTAVQRVYETKAALSQLKALAISTLPVEPSVIQRCQQMGLNTIAALMALPRAELGRRFGESLLSLLTQLQGRIEVPQCFYTPAETYQQKMSLMYDVEHIEGVLFPLSRMLSQLSDYLLQRQLAILRLQLTLAYRDNELPPLSLLIHYPFAEHRCDSLLALCRLQLERQTLYSPVVALQLDVSSFVEQHLDEDCWWQQRGVSAEIRQLFATLEARLGEHCVKGLAMASHHLPEQSCQVKPLTQWGQCGSRLALSDLSHKTAGIAYDRLAAERTASYDTLGLFRPSFLLKQPQPLALHEFTRLKGPERISPPWWLTQHDRDYYIAAHIDGGLCWVFYDGQDWFLQGWFS